MEVDDGADDMLNVELHKQRARQLLAVRRCIHKGLSRHKTLLRHFTREAQVEGNTASDADETGAGMRTGCNFRDVLRLGDHVSATLFAPQSWRPPSVASDTAWSWQPPPRLVGGFPPAPQPENMQKGLLGSHYSVRFSSSHNSASAVSSSHASPFAVTSGIGKSAGSVDVVSEQAQQDTHDSTWKQKGVTTNPIVNNNGPSDAHNDDGRSLEVEGSSRDRKRPRSPSPPHVGGSKSASGGGLLMATTQESHDLSSSHALNANSQMAKKSRAININFGFESDSEDDDEDEDDGN